MALPLIILGPPGAGKGTQAARFAARHEIPKISTGDILREAVQSGTEIGLRAKASMDRGELVGDDLVIGIVEERLRRPDARVGFILDGFPRTVPQAKSLDAIMTDRSSMIVVDIVVPVDELVRRLTIRLVCSACGANAEPGQTASPCVRCGGTLMQRSDDTGSVVRERLQVYNRQTRPLVEYYRSRPTFCSIDGAQPPDQVAMAIEGAVKVAARSAGLTDGLVQ